MVLEHYKAILEGKEEPNFKSADLDKKIEEAERLLDACCFCERRCGVNRKAGEVGNCGVGYESKVSSAFVHLGEESVLVPSGTIFFSGCNFHCVYCQNYDISQFPDSGEVWSPKEITGWIETNESSIRNVNFVGGDPTPNLHNILKALKACTASVPVVWNSNMYMSEEVMKILDCVVDLYLADFKYGNNKCGEKLSKVSKYFDVVSRNHKLGIKHADMIIRQLVLPSHTECCSKKVLKWIHENLDDKAYINIMSQYRPCHKAHEYPEINRFLTSQEYNSVVAFAKELGLENIEAQGV